ncbi:hypothetical protein HOE31_01525 [bacterium]|jgi:hypothetical protein|nr:hypothetical protein [bacterium]MBT4121609.1 hypothetical protein [bacterium]MBT4334997.1 hypothetical protein [bacterium]MBT4764015.1 hypothetical protein [bacterium]MBT5401387.1 hypothetical protein [bacterium]
MKKLILKLLKNHNRSVYLANGKLYMIDGKDLQKHFESVRIVSGLKEKLIYSGLIIEYNKEDEWVEIGVGTSDNKNIYTIPFNLIIIIKSKILMN